MVIREMATGLERTLPAEMVGTPSFSVDSESIAYVVRKPGGSLELQVVKPSTMEPRTLLLDAELTSITVVDWMPGGDALLLRLSRQDKSTELAVLPATGGPARRVLAPAPFSAGVDEARLSPDGRHVLYRLQTGGPAGSWTTRVRALDGTSDEMLVEHPTNAWVIGWTPDGRFAFYSAEPYSEGIWVVRVSGGKALGLPERVSGQTGRDGQAPRNDALG